MQPQAQQSEEILTVAEAAERAGISASRIRDWAACGKLECFREGRRIYVTAASLRVILRSRAQRRTRPRLHLVVDNSA